MTNFSTPTFEDQRWGPYVDSFFDYWQNPVPLLDSEGNRKNPLLIVRHGGGGTLGNHRDGRNDLFGGDVHYVWWLSGQNPTAPSVPWDLCQLTSGQVEHFDFFSNPVPFPRSRNIFMPDQVLELQIAIANIKHLAPVYGFDPRKVIIQGNSHGAVMTSLSQIFPPYRGSGDRHVYQQQAWKYGTHDSTVRGIVYEQGQIDCRKIGGVYQINPANFYGWFGGDAAEFDAVPDNMKATMSFLAYLEKREVQNYPGMLVAWNDGIGDHIKPYNDSHDSQQFFDLVAALAAAGLPFSQQLLQAGDLENTLWPNGPNASALALYQEREAWMNSRVGL